MNVAVVGALAVLLDIRKILRQVGGCAGGAGPWGPRGGVVPPAAQPVPAAHARSVRAPPTPLQDPRVIQKLHRRVFLDKLTRDECTIYLSFYVEAANRDAFMAGARGAGQGREGGGWCWRGQEAGGGAASPAPDLSPCFAHGTACACKAGWGGVRVQQRAQPACTTARMQSLHFEVSTSLEGLPRIKGTWSASRARGRTVLPL